MTYKCTWSECKEDLHLYSAVHVHDDGCWLEERMREVHLVPNMLYVSEDECIREQYPRSALAADSKRFRGNIAFMLGIQ